MMGGACVSPVRSRGLDFSLVAVLSAVAGAPRVSCSVLLFSIGLTIVWLDVGDKVIVVVTFSVEPNARVRH